jgi:hypothetical protein
VIGRSSEAATIFDGFLQLSWRPWRFLSAVAMMLMELSWSVAWFQFLVAPYLSLTLGTSFVFLGIWIASAYAATRGILFLRLHENARRVVMFVLFTIGMFMLLKVFVYPDQLFRVDTIIGSLNEAFKNTDPIIPVEIIVLGFAGYLWNRGITLANVWIDSRYAANRFRFGAVMLLVLAIGTASRGVAGLTLGFTLYLISSLLAIGASRASTIELLRGGRTRRFDTRWFLSLTLASTGVVLLAWFLGTLVTTEFGEFIVDGFNILTRVLLIVGLLIVSPLIFAMLFLFSLIDERLQVSPLFQEIKNQIGLVIGQVTEILDGLGNAVEGLWGSLPALPSIKPVLLWLTVGLLLIVVLFTVDLSRRRRIPWTLPSAAQDSAAESGAVRVWVGNLLGKNVEALSKRISRLRQSGRIFGAMRVRMVYLRLMHLCEALGHPRQRMQTPLEFLPTLRILFPNHSGEIELITATYNRVRYGELPEYRRDVQRVEKAWKIVREQGRTLKQVQKHLDKNGS